MLFKAQPHQVDTIKFILKHEDSAAFLPCGMGKTAITLSVFKMLKNRKMINSMLVVAPVRPAKVTWPDEIKKWDHTKDFSYVVLSDIPVANRADALKKPYDIYLINRELIPWLRDTIAKEKICPFDMIVIDELSSFKNYKGTRTKAMMQIRCLPTIRRVVGLTGTPTPNGLMDLFSQMKIIDKGMRLGQYITHYRETYFNPGKRKGSVVYNWVLKPGADKAIYKKISDIVISKETNESLKLPPMVRRAVNVYLDPDMLTKYNEFKSEMVIDFLKTKSDPYVVDVLTDPKVLSDALTDDERLDILEHFIELGLISPEQGKVSNFYDIIDYLKAVVLDTVTASSAGVLSGYLQQLANGAIYLDEEPVDDEETPETEETPKKKKPKGDRPYKVWHDKKLEALEDLVEAQNGAPCLVAYWFKHDKDRILKYFAERKIEVHEINSASDIQKWNLGLYKVALIHPAAASHGLNLQEGGSTLIWFSLTWSLEFYQQLNKRLHRQGQTASSVVIHHLITKGTVDEKIIRALQKKDATQENLLKAVVRDEISSVLSPKL